MAGRTAIGLDIGTSAVRAAEVSVRGGTVRLLHFGQVPLPVGAVHDGAVEDVDAVASAIRELWRGAGLRGKKVSLGVANQHVSVRTATFPWLPPKEFRSSLRYQAADLVPMPLDEAVFDFVPLHENDGDGNRTVTGLLVVAAQMLIDRSIAAATAAGLQPVGVDLVPFAIMRSVAGAEPPGAGPEALVDVGSRVTNVVVHHGGMPTFVRVLLMGGQDLTQAVTDRVGVDVATAESMKRAAAAVPGPQGEALRRALSEAIGRLTDEVRGSLDYFQATNAGPPVTRIVLSGGGSQAEGLAAQLGQRNRVPVVLAQPFAAVTPGRTGLTDEQLAFVSASAAVPLGLAIGGAR